MKKERKTKQSIPILVAEIINPCKLVINKGSVNGVIEGRRFLIYELSKEEIKDPHTDQSLGFLEIVKGTGKAIHVQDKMTTIESDMEIPPERKIIRKDTPFSWYRELGTETIIPSGKLKPFRDVKVGDKVKPI